MLRFLFLRFVLPLIAFLILRSIVKSVWGVLNSTVATRPPSAEGPKFRTGGELKQDPVCGTYVSVNTSFTRVVKGKAVHFCSAECRDKYRAA
jgi:YHS domain-containing protein